MGSRHTESAAAKFKKRTWTGAEELEALRTGVEDGRLAGVDDGLDGVVTGAVKVGTVLAVLQELVVLDGELHVLKENKT